MFKRAILAAAAISLAALTGCDNNNFYNSRSAITAPIASVSTAALLFNTVPLGTTSATQTVTLTNTGSGTGVNTATALILHSIQVVGPNESSFLISSNCPTNIPAGTQCQITVAFAPAASGALSATLQIEDNAANSLQTVALTGTGSASGPVVSLSSTALNFAQLPVGQASTQTVTVSNIGTSSLSLNGFTVTGANASSFALSGSCLTTGLLAANANCFLTVTYAPTVTGILTAQVNINDSAPNSPQVITLTTH